jgi:hypothetical protein
MSTSINLTLPLQLADDSGTIGTFLSQDSLRELLAERDSLRSALDETRQELERLRRHGETDRLAVAELKRERKTTSKGRYAPRCEISSNSTK